MRRPERGAPDPDPVLVAFGELVRRRRLRAWMTQRQFGDEVDLDQGSVSRLEHGLLGSIRLYRLAPVLDALGLVRPTERSPDSAEPPRP